LTVITVTAFAKSIMKYWEIITDRPSIICKSNNRVTFPVQRAGRPLRIYVYENKINNHTSRGGLV